MKRSIVIISIFVVLAMVVSGCIGDEIVNTETPTPTVQPNPDMPEGDSIPFDVGVRVNIRHSDYENARSLWLVTSYEQLRSIYNNDSNPNAINYIQNYNEEFFEENALVVLFIRESISSGIGYQINSLIKNDNELYVGITRIRPTGLLTSNEANWRILIEVRQSDVAGVETLNYVIHEIDVPEN